MPDRTRPKTVVWMEPDQASLIRSVAAIANLDIIAVGNSRTGRAADAINALALSNGDIRPLDDLRAELTSAHADLFLLAATGDFAAGIGPSRTTSSDGDDLALHDARARGVRVITLEPMPAGLLQLDVPTLAPQPEPLVALGPGSGFGGDSGSPNNLAGSVAEWADFCPLLRLSESVRAAHDVLEQVRTPGNRDDASGPGVGGNRANGARAGTGGGLRLLCVECWGAPHHGSLGARLYDALEAVVHFMGIPDRIDAAYVAPVRSRAVHALPGESLRGLEGDITVNLRFADGRAASIVASSCAGRWNRSLTFVGENGRLRVYDDGFVWTGRDGKLIDSSRSGDSHRGSAASADPSAHAASAIADHIARTLDPAHPPDQPIDVVGVLATAGAALLSARTGESESPATMLRMAGTG